MDFRPHQIIQRRIHRAVPGDRGHSGKSRADHPHAVMASPIPGAFVTDVMVAVVNDVQFGWRERSLQSAADRIHPLCPRQWLRGLAHGSTGRNGRTSTRA